MGYLHTFVIVAYKESKYLRNCIESLKNQTVKSNIIISTSTPNKYIEDLAKEYNLELYINYGETGIGQDWNFGFDRAKTKYVTIAHQDDIYKSDYAKEIIEKMETDKDSIIAFTNYLEIKEGKEIEKTKNLKIKEKMLSFLKKSNNSSFGKWIALSLGCGICCPSVTINKQISGNSPYKTILKCDLDWDTWNEMRKTKKGFSYIPKDLMCHRIHEESETSNLIKNNLRLEEDLIMLEKFWPKPIAKMIFKRYKEAVKTND